MQSEQANQVRELTQSLFPYCTIFPEYFVKFKGQTLYFDFYLKELNILIEVQGAQHYEYNKHFHGNREGFVSSKRRDNLKKEYCELERMALVIIPYNEKVDKKKLLHKFSKALEKL